MTEGHNRRNPVSARYEAAHGAVTAATLSLVHTCIGQPQVFYMKIGSPYGREGKRGWPVGDQMK